MATSPLLGRSIPTLGPEQPGPLPRGCLILYLPDADCQPCEADTARQHRLPAALLGFELILL